MMKKISSLALFAVLTAQAHPGHGPLQHGASHFVTSPFHLATGLALSAALWIAAHWLQNSKQRLAVRAAAATMATVALLLWA